jgi:hypothetical protein
VAEFSYQLGFNVAKQLPAISDPLLDVDFCSSTGASQNPPTLRFSLPASGTAAVEGVYSFCATAGTTQVSILGTSQFGTAVSSSWVLLEEKSSHTAAVLRVVFSDTVALETCQGCVLRNRDVAMFRARAGVALLVRADTTNSTGTVQITTIGE